MWIHRCKFIHVNSYMWIHTCEFIPSYSANMHLVHWVIQHNNKPVWWYCSIQCSMSFPIPPSIVLICVTTWLSIPWFLVLCCIPLIWCAPLPCQFVLESQYNFRQLDWTNEWHKRHHPTVWMQVLHCHKSFWQELLNGVQSIFQ
jgi:hypothetical protein